MERAQVFETVKKYILAQLPIKRRPRDRETRR